MREYADELYHWKYIKKRKMPNGKWRYYYNSAELDLFDRNATGTYTDSRGNIHTNMYQQTNKLFSDGDVSLTSGLFNGGTTTSTIKSQGKLERARAKGERWVYENFLKNKNR